MLKNLSTFKIRSVRQMVMVPAALTLIMASHSNAATDYLLSYTAPAAKWLQCLPIGNGSIGGMIYGGVASDQIQFNEITLWQGGTCQNSSGSSSCVGNYLGFGTINVTQTVPGGTSSNYQRNLDIGEAVAQVSYTAGSINFNRAYLCSYPDSVMVIHYTASAGASISLMVSVTAMKGLTSSTVAASGNVITLSGYQSAGSSSLANTDFESQVYVKNYNGTSAVSGAEIQVTGADSVDIFMAVATNFLQSYTDGFRGAVSPHTTVTARIADATLKTYPEILSAHLADYQNLFNRFTLTLNDSVNTGVPTNTRIANYTVDTTSTTGRDLGLDVLFTQFGRYLMISFSRNSLPANEQGLWNMYSQPQWYCDYHADVNNEMNYSFVEPMNIPECMQPYSNMINSMQPACEAATRITYPTSKGWALRTGLDMMGGSDWCQNNGGAAWMVHALWEHFAFTLDTFYLRDTALPIMKEVCQFWQSHLVDSSNGSLITPDGWSPENGPNNNAYYIESGTAYDQQLAWDLFTNYSKGQNICKTDTFFRDTVEGLLAKLDNGVHIGTAGDIKEWPSGATGEANMRHISHLVCLYPGAEVSPMIDTNYSKAAVVSLTKYPAVPNARGDGTTGWSCAMRADCFARLFLGNRAYRQLCLQLKGFVYPDLFDACSAGYVDTVMQVDGNFGYPSAVAEMLLQSHTGFITMLPALPTPWQTGSVTGLCARGAFTVDMNWANLKLTTGTIHSRKGTTCQLRIDTTNLNIYSNGARITPTVTGSSYHLPVIEFPTTAGNAYLITYGTTGVGPHGIAASEKLFRMVVKGNSIEFCCPMAGSKRFEILNMQGKTIFSKVTDLASFTWNRTGAGGRALGAGSYFVRVSYQGRNFTRKLFVCNE